MQIIAIKIHNCIQTIISIIGLSNEYATRIESPTSSSSSSLTSVSSSSNSSSNSSNSLTSDNSDVRILAEAIDLRVNTEIPTTLPDPFNMPGKK